MRKKRILAINVVLVLALGAAGWGAYTLLWPSEESSANSGVRTVAATRTSVVETVSAAATVQSAYTADADFGTSGTVTEINVKVGDSVAAGQQLAKLDDTEARQQVTVAQSNLAAAQEDLETAEDAAGDTGTTGQGGGNAQSVAAAEAKVDQARLALIQAKDARTATVLTAPGAGTVTAINGSVGQRVGGSGNSSAQGSSDSDSGGSAFIVLTDLANLVVRANVAEIDVSKIKTDQEATVTVNAVPDTPVAAKVTQVDLTPTTSNNVVQFGVTLGLTTPPQGLRPGQSASVAITVARADDALAVPSAAVRTAGGQTTVTVLDNGTESTRTVEVGVRSESLVQITSGISEGDQVVLATSGATTGGTGGTGGQGRLGGGTGGFQGGPGGGVIIPGGGR
ncbi:efflux RND transporter periplasmic adaptor subunit [Actinophytocola sp.]|uniref:efflux RND transporter periplasmic adaptor subunit n=1 Tax=Actinophytocola sp. TaxID=1872138 RepID=UPI002D80934B|nr:efflux RND transporter periplasmic adaptor subunit [Actinophytocola sp.]HET9138684.1 efflux RND transporter periplasmic adaptor subunit [Actinophytocola sp.]